MSSQFQAHDNNETVSLSDCSVQDLAISLNDSGIVCLRAGQSFEAMEVFRDALTYVKNQFTKSESVETNSLKSAECVERQQKSDLHISLQESEDFEGDDNDSMECETAVECNGFIRTKLHVQSVPISSGMKTKPQNAQAKKSTEDDSVIAMYDRALHVTNANDDDDDEDDHSLTLFDQEFLGSIVTYNMALASHRVGVKSGMVPNLLKAMQLYRISYQIIQDYLENDSEALFEQSEDTEQQPCCETSSLSGVRSNSNIALLLMAIFNNMAHISSLLYTIDEMRQCLDNLRNILCDCREQKMQSPLLDTDEFLVFFMNAMITQEAIFTIAPAA